jgi:hypothetical protein
MTLDRSYSCDDDVCSPVWLKWNIMRAIATTQRRHFGTVLAPVRGWRRTVPDQARRLD